MASLFWFICVPVGFIIGGIAGVVGTGYLCLFFSLEHAQNAAQSGSFGTMAAWIGVVLFSKVAIFIGGVCGAVLGIIPGFVGLWYCDNKSSTE